MANMTSLPGFVDVPVQSPLDGRRLIYDEAECDRQWETKVAASLHGTR